MGPGRVAINRGLRVLIVEDEFLAAVALEEDLHQEGWTTLGPYVTLAQTLNAAETEDFDLAVLDINLKGEMVYPLADELTARSIPFIFLSGYAGRDLPERFRTCAKLTKPCNAAVLRAEIKRVLDQG